MAVVCSCKPEYEYKDAKEWSEHLHSGRPVDLTARREHHAKHQPSLSIVKGYVSMGLSAGEGSSSRVSSDPIVRLHEISRLIESHYGDIIRLEEERFTLIQENVETFIKKASKPEWSRSDVLLTCSDCGRKTTFWKHRGVAKHKGGCPVDKAKQPRATAVDASLWKVFDLGEDE